MGSFSGATLNCLWFAWRRKPISFVVEKRIWFLLFRLVDRRKSRNGKRVRQFTLNRNRRDVNNGFSFDGCTIRKGFESFQWNGHMLVYCGYLLRFGATPKPLPVSHSIHWPIQWHTHTYTHFRSYAERTNRTQSNTTDSFPFLFIQSFVDWLWISTKRIHLSLSCIVFARALTIQCQNRLPFLSIEQKPVQSTRCQLFFPLSFVFRFFFFYFLLIFCNFSFVFAISILSRFLFLVLVLRWYRFTIFPVTFWLQYFQLTDTENVSPIFLHDIFHKICLRKYSISIQR